MADNSGCSSLVRTRFAPSPTGLLHIGGAHTALFNYLWAKRNDGAFLLRFEDTDKVRSSEEYASRIEEDLTWLGLSTEGLAVRQSGRAARHREVLAELIAQEAVYPCYCCMSEDPCSCRRLSEAEKQERAAEPHCFRFAVPAAGELFCFQDRLHGEISVPYDSISDFVIMREDESPTYLFAVVVDDHDAEISHVIRGEEHISNTPKQEMIYRALGWRIPEWVHIPMILDEGHRKLGKRTGAPSIASLREAGWDPLAITAYLATLSWSRAPADRLLTLEELASFFALDDVALSSPVHDEQRMAHFGQLSLLARPLNELLDISEEAFCGFMSSDEDRKELITELLPQCATTAELMLSLNEALSAPPRIESPPEWVLGLASGLAALDDDHFTCKEIKPLLRDFARGRNLSGRDFYHTVRHLLTGREEGPPIALIIACCGRKETLSRLGM